MDSTQPTTRRQIWGGITSRTDLFAEILRRGSAARDASSSATSDATAPATTTTSATTKTKRAIKGFHAAPSGALLLLSPLPADKHQEAEAEETGLASLASLQDTCLHFFLDALVDGGETPRSSIVAAAVARLGVDLRLRLLEMLVELRAVTDEALDLLLDASLKQLSLARCVLVSNAGLEAIAKRCPNMEDLNLAQLHRPTVDGLLSLLSGCPRLHCLQLAGWQQLDDHTLSQLLAEAQRTGHRTTLTALTLKNTGITSKGLSLLAGSNGIVDRSVASGGEKVDDGEASSIPLPNLEVIDLRWLKDWDGETVAAVARQCKKLHSIDVAWCSNIVDDSLLDRLGKAFGERLQHINLEMCFSISDAGVDSLCQYCPNLKHLRLKNCQHLTDQSLYAIGRFCKSLVALNISGCTGCTWEGVKAILRSNGPSIQALSLLGVNLLSSSSQEEMLSHLLSSCPALKALDLPGEEDHQPLCEERGVYVVRRNQLRGGPDFTHPLLDYSVYDSETPVTTI
ncbi:UV-damaged DNA-binding protein rad7 [Balamuthia mandrillaris]